MRQLFLAALIMAFAGQGSPPPQLTARTSSTSNTDHGRAISDRRESLWQRTRSDPVAVYTFVLALFTGALAVVSAVQGGFLLRADRTARIAANAARESADATKESVATMKQTAERQLRAYLTITGFKPAKSLVSPGLAEFIMFLKNSGQTPAYNVRPWSITGASKVPLAHKLEWPRIAVPETILGPGESTEIPAGQNKPFPPQIIEAIAAGTLSLYVYGRVEYRDIFGRDHYLNFCGHGLEHGLFRRCDEFNDAD